MPSSISLTELLRAGAVTERGECRPIPEAQIATLLEAFARYAAPCPFKPGDLVTPRKGFGYTDEGAPHIVLEIREAPVCQFDITDRTSPASNLFGLKLDMRVACFRSSGDVEAFWQESWRHETYQERKP
jgi:hypothetical protein